MAAQAGCGAAGKNITLDADDGGGVGVPIGAVQLTGGIEDGDDAAFVPVAAAVVGVDRGERRCGRRDVLDLLVQGRLVVFDLDDQSNAGCCSDLEKFFWQCSASSVTMAPSAIPSSASSACAAGISLDFSAISTCASTSEVSVAKAPST